MAITSAAILTVFFCVCACDKVIVNNAGLTHIPTSNITANTTELHLNNNSITAIALGDLSSITQLIILYLEDNEFTEFPYLCDVGDSLLELSMRGNRQLDSMPSTPLQCLHKITRLDLSKTGLREMPDLSPIGQSLENVYLQSLYLSTIDPNKLVNLSVLRLLDLSLNEFTTIPDLSVIGASLQVLKLRKNKISVIAVNTWQDLSVMKVVHLESNSLTSFPDFGEASDTISDVYIDYNPITQINTQLLFNMINLRKIGFEGENLPSLPDLSGMRGNLEVLRIESTRLTTLPSLHNMTQLLSLTITSCQYITQLTVKMSFQICQKRTLTGIPVY